MSNQNRTNGSLNLLISYTSHHILHECAELLVDPRRFLQRRYIHPRQRPLPRELLYIFLEVLHLLVPNPTLLFLRRSSNKVFEKLRASLFLERQSNLNGAVQEVSNDFDVGFAHVTGRESGSTKTDTARCLCGRITGNGIF